MTRITAIALALSIKAIATPTTKKAKIMKKNNWYDVISFFFFRAMTIFLATRFIKVTIFIDGLPYS